MSAKYREVEQSTKEASGYMSFLGRNIMSPKTRLSSKSDKRFRVRTVTSGRDGVLERLVNFREELAINEQSSSLPEVDEDTLFRSPPHWRRGRREGGLLHILNLSTQELHIIRHGLIILVLELLVVAELLSSIC